MGNAEHDARRKARLDKWLEKTRKVRQIWERQDELGDTAESWPYFVAYRDAKPGNRRLDLARRALDDRATRPGGVMPTLEQMRKWHDECDWAARVAAYDAHMDSIRQEEQEAVLRRTASERQAERLQTIGTMKDAVQKEVDKLAAKVESMEGEVLKPGELLKAVELVNKIERLEMGESTENTKTEIDLTGMSDEALEELVAAGERSKAGK